MDRVVSARRHRVGRDVMAVETLPFGIVLEGRERLRPGQVVVLVNVPATNGPEDRLALVDSWGVSRVGSDGTLYRGVCRWQESPG